MSSNLSPRPLDALTLSKLSLDQAFDAVIWLNKAGNIVYANLSASQYLGYHQDELTQLTVFDLDPNFSPEMWEQHTENHIRLKAVSLESKHLTKDRRLVDVEITCNYVEHGDDEYFCTIIRDITERKQVEDSLNLANLVCKETSQAMLVTDAENNIVSINPAFTQLTGYNWDDVLGKNPKILSSGLQSDGFYAEMWEKLKKSGSWQGEIWNRKKNGEIYAEWLSINTAYDENGAVYRRIALFTDITEIKKTEEFIWRQANFDVLTNLPNRRMVNDRLDFEIKKSHRVNLPLALLFIDLDGFKEVNDTFGHETGDQLLIETASRLLGCVRESDTVGRLGGDEFIVILGELDADTSIDRISKAILEKIAQPFYLGDAVVTISASIGVAMYPNDAEEVTALLKKADSAMYAAKRGGKNQYRHYSSKKD